MNLTQSDLGKFVGMSSQPVARWEKGESDITRAADLLVRAIYIQHVGRLLDLRRLVSSLKQTDARDNKKRYFEKTSRGWRARKAYST